MGRHGLCHHLRRLPAARRPRGRPARPAARLPRRRAGLHRCLVLLRARLVGRRAHRVPRRAGPGRGDHLACGAVDHHDDVRGRRRAEQGARDLGSNRRRRGRRRRSRRRLADEVPGLGVDLLRERPGRRHRLRPRPPLRPREPARAGTRRRTIAGAVTVTAGLALLVYAVSSAPNHGWGSGWTLSRLAVGGRPAGGVPRDRVAGEGPAHAVLDLPHPHGRRRERRRRAARRCRVRELLHPDAVRPAGARLLGAEDGSHVRRDGGQRRPLRGARAGAGDEDRGEARDGDRVSWR